MLKSLLAKRNKNLKEKNKESQQLSDNNQQNNVQTETKKTVRTRAKKVEKPIEELDKKQTSNDSNGEDDKK